MFVRTELNTDNAGDCLESLIVCSPEDAYRCFMGTDLDVLVIEDFILYKEDQDKSLIKDYKDQFELD